MKCCGRKKDLGPKRLYSGFGIDLVAMNANDLICLGATPIVLSGEIASGDSSWFEKKEEVEGLLLGLKKGCNQAGITIPCGETPTLQMPSRVPVMTVIDPKNAVLAAERILN